MYYKGFLTYIQWLGVLYFLERAYNKWWLYGFILQTHQDNIFFFKVLNILDTKFLFIVTVWQLLIIGKKNTNYLMIIKKKHCWLLRLYTL